MHGSRPLLAVSVAVLWLVLPSTALAQSFAGRVTRYVDPDQQTRLSFGERSHWLQPWRAYMDTVPATRLKDSVGIQFNVEPQEASSTARLLSATGFRRARLEVGWAASPTTTPHSWPIQRPFGPS